MATILTASGFKGIETLRSYQHAKKIFVDSRYRLSPKYGFLFYVEFDFNPLITNLNTRTAQEMGMVVKSVNLPSFSIDTKVHNAYNRKNIVQNNIKYDPITITFHDDQSNNILNFWYDYYSYYYRDPDYADSTYNAYHKYQSRPTFDWGYTPRPAIGYNGSNGAQPYQYMQSIRLYSLYQSNFDEYELINPIITNFKHGDLTNGPNNNLLQHEMTIQYETVKYLTGQVTTDTAGGFIDLLYDLAPSPNINNGGPTGQSPAYETNSHQIVDSASLLTTPGSQINQALVTTAQPASMPVSDALKEYNKKMAGAQPNNGGFSIPALGSLTQGVTNSTMIKQNLEQAGIGLAGASVSSLASGLTNGIANSLGPAGGSLIGLAASAIANPSQTLRTVENMGISMALGIAVNQVSSIVSNASGSLGSIGSSFGNSIAKSDSYKSISKSIQNVGTDISKLFGG